MSFLVAHYTREINNFVFTKFSVLNYSRNLVMSKFEIKFLGITCFKVNDCCIRLPYNLPRLQYQDIGVIFNGSILHSKLSISFVLKQNFCKVFPKYFIS